MFDWLKQYNKAIISAAVAAAIVFLKAYTDDHTVSGEEWLQIIGAAAAAGGFTFAVPNVPKPTAPAARE